MYARPYRAAWPSRIGRGHHTTNVLDAVQKGGEVGDFFGFLGHRNLREHPDTAPPGHGRDQYPPAGNRKIRRQPGKVRGWQQRTPGKTTASMTGVFPLVRTHISSPVRHWGQLRHPDPRWRQQQICQRAGDGCELRKVPS